MEDIGSIARQNIEKIKNSDYPGRGIVLGVSPSGKELVQIYWTMGRSASSKNRMMCKEDGVVKVKPIDESVEMQNESLIIYNATAHVGKAHVVTNGRQTDTIAEYLKNGKSFEGALREWSFEDDPPIYTPRISGLVFADGANSICMLSIIKALGQNPDLLTHQFFEYNTSLPGYGHCIHTYSLSKICDSFSGEPYLLTVFDDINENAEHYWNALPKDKRVALYVKHINIINGEAADRIINN